MSYIELLPYKPCCQKYTVCEVMLIQDVYSTDIASYYILTSPAVTCFPLCIILSSSYLVLLTSTQSTDQMNRELNHLAVTPCTTCRYTRGLISHLKQLISRPLGSPPSSDNKSVCSWQEIKRVTFLYSLCSLARCH